MGRNGLRRISALLALSSAAGCFYRLDQFPIELAEGDVTGVVVGVPPGEVGVRALSGARAGVRNSSIVRTAGSNGRFVIRNLPQGTHTIVVEYDPNHDRVADSARKLEFPIEVINQKRQSLNLGDVVLLPAGRIHGFVEGTTDFSQARVSVEGHDFSVVPASNGEFALPGLAEGHWRIAASAPGLISDAVEVTVTSGGATELSGRLALHAATGTGTLQVTMLNDPTPTRTSDLGAVEQGLSGDPATVTLTRIVDGVEQEPRTLDGDDIAIYDVEAGLYAVRIIPCDGCEEVVLPQVLVHAGEVSAIENVVARRERAPTCIDHDGDLLCQALGDADCVTRCQSGSLLDGCGEGRKLDCDDDADGQADTEEALHPCRCGVTAEHPFDGKCEDNPFRWDNNFNAICDIFEPVPNCVQGRCDSTGTSSSSGGSSSEGGSSGIVTSSSDDASSGIEFPSSDMGGSSGAPDSSSVGGASSRMLTPAIITPLATASPASASSSAGGPSNFQVDSVAALPDGSMVLVGTSNGIIQFSQVSGICPDVGNSSFSRSSVVAKLAPDGSCVWAKALGDVPSNMRLDAVAADTAHGVFLAGRAAVGLTYDNVTIRTSDLPLSIFVMRVDLTTGAYTGDIQAVVRDGSTPRDGLVALPDGTVGWLVNLVDSMPIPAVSVGGRMLQVDGTASTATFLTTLGPSLQTATLLSVVGDAGQVSGFGVVPSAAGGIIAVGTSEGDITLGGTDVTGRQSGVGNGVRDVWTLRAGPGATTSAFLRPKLTITSVDEGSGDFSSLTVTDFSDGRMAIGGCVQRVQIDVGAPLNRTYSPSNDVGAFVTVSNMGAVTNFEVIHGDDGHDGQLQCRSVRRSEDGSFIMAATMFKTLGARHLAMGAASDDAVFFDDPMMDTLGSDALVRVDGATVRPMELYTVRDPAFPTIKGAFGTRANGIVAWGSTSGRGVTAGLHAGCSGADVNASDPLMLQPTDPNEEQTYVVQLPFQADTACPGVVPPAATDSGGSFDAPVAAGSLSMLIPFELEALDDEDCFFFTLTADMLPNPVHVRTSDLDGGCNADTVVTTAYESMPGMWFEDFYGNDDAMDGVCSDLIYTVADTARHAVCVRSYAGKPLTGARVILEPVAPPPNAICVGDDVTTQVQEISMTGSSLVTGSLAAAGDEGFDLACQTTTSGPRPDVFYTFTTMDPSPLEVRLWTQSPQLHLALGTGAGAMCPPMSPTCVAGPLGNAVTTITPSTQLPNRIVVEAGYSDGSFQFNLRFRRVDQNVNSGSQACYMISNQNTLGVPERRAHLGSTSLSGQSRYNGSDYATPDLASSCPFTLFSAERAYQFVLANGDALVVGGEADNGRPPVLYMLDACPDMNPPMPPQCIAQSTGVMGDNFRNELGYANNTGMTQTVFLFVEENGSSDYTLDWVYTPAM